MLLRSTSTTHSSLFTSLNTSRFAASSRDPSPSGDQLSRKNTRFSDMLDATQFEPATRQEKVDKLAEIKRKIKALKAEERKSTRGLITATAKNIFGCKTPTEHYRNRSSKKKAINALKIEEDEIVRAIRDLRERDNNEKRGWCIFGPNLWERLVR